MAEDIGFAGVRERFCDLWERRHRPIGFEVECWFMAERELKAERKAQQAREVIATKRS